MPYIDGKRVSNEEWTARYGSIQKLHTGPDGENPAPAGEVADAAIPKGQPKSAGGKRGKRSEKAAKAAIAGALGVKANDEVLDDIDVTGSDAVAEVADEAQEEQES